MKLQDFDVGPSGCPCLGRCRLYEGRQRYNMFNPKQYVTRGEAVNVLYRIMTGAANQPEPINLEDKAFYQH